MSLSPNAELILRIVGGSQEGFTVNDLLARFSPDDRRSVIMTIARLKSSESGKLVERGGRLFAGEDHGELAVKGFGRNTVIEEDEFYGLACAHEMEVAIPAAMRDRPLTQVKIQIVTNVRDVMRIGYANTLSETGITWIAPGNSVFLVQVGNFEPDSRIELVQHKYLCVVVSTKKEKGKLKFFTPPVNQQFAVMWTAKE